MLYSGVFHCKGYTVEGRNPKKYQNNKLTSVIFSIFFQVNISIMGNYIDNQIIDKKVIIFLEVVEYFLLNLVCS